MSSMSSKSKIIKRLLTALSCVGLFPTSASTHVPTPPKDPSQIGRRVVKITVPDFKLTDQNNVAFQFHRTRGKVVLATFIFTSCPDVCPLFTAKFAAIQRRLEKASNTDYWLLSITTDPEQDSAAKLNDYAGLFNADLRRWAFLTGSRTALAKVWSAFGVNVTRTQSGQVFHTALTTLIDRRGNRRIDYYGDKWREQEVLKDFQWLSAQK